jgi:uncharacterized membrane protein YhaH (DUF805 family)
MTCPRCPVFGSGAADSFENHPKPIDSEAMENPYAAPQGEIVNEPSAFTPLTWKQILFSFEGRIPRRQYWAATGLFFLVAFAAGLIVPIFEHAGVLDASPAWLVLLVPLGFFAVWIGFAVGIKRWHDRDKSGWWVLIGVIPYIGAIWQLIECGCLRGTEGPNRFGGDPT